MNDTLRRTARTFLQGFVAVLALLAVPVLNGLIDTVSAGGDVTIDLDLWQNVAVAALAGGLVALVSFAQNLFEDKTGATILPK